MIIHNSIYFLLQIHGNSLHVIEGHVRYVTSCSFSYDGLFLVSGSNDRTAVIWKITNEDELFSMYYERYEIIIELRF